MNNNNWGSQPPRQAYNGLPQIPQQPTYPQQYGSGNTMAYMGNQQYQTNPHQYLPAAHQMPQMPQYTHTQHQMQAAHNFQAQQQQQQQQQQMYNDNMYTQNASTPAGSYIAHQSYAHANPSYPSQQIAVPSPRQMQQSVPSPRPQGMSTAAQQTQHHQLQSQPQPMAQLHQPQPLAQFQHHYQQQQQPPHHHHHQQQPAQAMPSNPQPRIPQQHRPSLPSLHQQHQQQQHATQIKPQQLHYSQPHMPSPQAQRRPLQGSGSSQHNQSHAQVSSPQVQHHNSPSVTLSQARIPASTSSPHLQNRTQPLAPNQFQTSQAPVPVPQAQQLPVTSIDPSQLQRNDGYSQTSQIEQYNPVKSDHVKPQQDPQAIPPPSQPQPPLPDAINPSSLQRSQPQAPATTLQPHQTILDGIDPTKLHKQSIRPDIPFQQPASDAIDPIQLMMKMDAPARKVMPTAPGASRSPSITHVHSPSQHFDTPAVLTCVANDCFRAAHIAVHDVATSLDQVGMDEYYKLIATGLGCLEAALSLNKLPPRAEANVRLRYATILSEETDNLTEAEVALTKGIAVCEKNRLTDLKYCMQFQLLKVLYRRNRKAALVALDKNISEATTYKAVDWVYAFRFLKASFHLQTGNPADTHAVENLRNITSLAAHRGDHTIAVMTSLLEGMLHLKARKDDSIVRVQTCIAQAARYQLDPSVHLPQIEVLTLLLDLACSLQQKSPQVTMQKLKALQFRMDELVQASDWDSSRDELLLPLKKQTNSSSTVTEDTSTIIRPGAEHNFIVMSFVTKVHAFVLAYVLSGLALFYNGSKNEKLMEYWNEALNMLTKRSDVLRPAAHSLPMAIEQAKWRSEVGCYIYTLIALTSATRTQWIKVHECIKKLEALRPVPGTGRLDVLMLYVKGVYYQGTGDLDKALEIFGDAQFDFTDTTNNPSSEQLGTAPSEIALLAALNRIWIMQEPSRRNDYYTSEILEKIRPYCVDHADTDIRTAFNLVAAAVETNPPQSIQTVKRHISTGLRFAQATNNTQLLGIALNLMRACLFDSVVGDQAVKSAKAGRAQAQKAGNLLWMSVGEGMLAQTEEMQGQVQEAEWLRANGTAHANQAFVKPHID